MNERILVVDDHAANIRLFTRLLTQCGYAVLSAGNGVEALAIVQRESPDLVLTDVMMPGIDGIELCARIKAAPQTRLTPVVLVTALTDPGDRLRGIEAGADDFLQKPVDAHELTARVRSLVRLKRYTDDLDSAESVILSLALTIEARDPYTDGHCQRLSQYAAALGQRLSLDAVDVEALRWGGALHDIGKVGVPDRILLKPGPLTDDEFELLKRHTVIGDRLCGELRSLRRVRPIVRHHHERLDGSGYPDGLKGDEIPLIAQVMTVVDVYDALTSDRPYRAAMSQAAALEELVQQARRGWLRPSLVDELIAMVT